MKKVVVLCLFLSVVILWGTSGAHPIAIDVTPDPKGVILEGIM